MAQRYTIEDFLSCRIDDQTDVPAINPIITIKDSNFAIRGDIAIVGGLPKTGKTTVCSFMMATALMKSIPSDLDTLGIRTTYCEGRLVVYVDTEQPKAYTDQLRKQTLRLIDATQHPENLHIVNLRQFDCDTKKEGILMLMDRFPDAHLWIIDGVADLIKDPNNVEQSFGIIEKMMIKSDELNTTIVLHIHQNPGGQKLRGNLGSEAERKCGGAIYLSKDKENQVHSIKPGVIRGTEDFDPIYFKYSKIEKRMISLTPEEILLVEKKADPAEKKYELRTKLAERITLKGGNTISYKELVNRIMIHSLDIEGKTISERTAKERVKEMMVLNLLLKNEETGKYRLNNGSADS